MNMNIQYQRTDPNEMDEMDRYGGPESHQNMEKFLWWINEKKWRQLQNHSGLDQSSLKLTNKKHADADFSY